MARADNSEKGADSIRSITMRGQYKSRGNQNSSKGVTRLLADRQAERGSASKGPRRRGGGVCSVCLQELERSRCRQEVEREALVGLVMSGGNSFAERDE